MPVFISALDWGLGHATRIIPIINGFIDKHEEVILGASEKQEILYREFFPEVLIVRSKSFSPVYPKGKNLLLKIAFQVPSFLISIFREHRQLKKMIQDYGISKVISDNQYGLYNKKIHSIFIGHQINIKLPRKIRIIEGLVNRLNTYFINRFNECWIPDEMGEKSLAGDLSAPKRELKNPPKYIGILSRFSIVDEEKPDSIPELLILISGPEKQRTLFENNVLHALSRTRTPMSYLIIRGLPDENMEPIPNALNHCSSGKLKGLILGAKYIICRSGYSTLMDLVYLKRNAVLVPTPGQTEQEYLADYLNEKEMFPVVSQGQINIQQIISGLNA